MKLCLVPCASNMSVPSSVDKNDPFWVVQLSSSGTAETKPFELGGLRADYEVCVENEERQTPNYNSLLT